jgi:hypothetical protein
MEVASMGCREESKQRGGLTRSQSAGSVIESRSLSSVQSSRTRPNVRPCMTTCVITLSCEDTDIFLFEDLPATDRRLGKARVTEVRMEELTHSRD